MKGRKEEGKREGGPRAKGVEALQGNKELAPVLRKRKGLSHHKLLQRD